MISLSADQWQGQARKDKEIADVSEQEFTAAVDQLDGRSHTEILLQNEIGRALTIGGGPDRFLVQYLLPEDTGAWVAISGADAEGEEDLTINRQRDGFPKRNIVSKTVALDAGQAFLRDGERSPTVTWEQSF